MIPVRSQPPPSVWHIADCQNGKLSNEAVFVTALLSPARPPASHLVLKRAAVTSDVAAAGRSRWSEVTPGCVGDETGQWM